MKIFNSKWGVLLLIFAFTNAVFGQGKDAQGYQTKDKETSRFSLSLGFINDAVFLGRKDFVSTPYLFPSLTYYNKSGFYATGSFSYLTKSNESRIDLFLGTVGYDFNVKKFDADVSFTKYFFNNDSYNVISEVEADITAVFSYDFNVINLGISATTFFNNNSDNDFILSSEISHDFTAKNKKVQISPTIGIFFGSQNFYEEYYVNTRFRGGNASGSGFGPGSGQGMGAGVVTKTTSVILNESEKFDLMALELSLPILYNIYKPIVITFLPIWAIPQNPATLTIEDIVYEEDLENSFYWLIGVSYVF